MSATAWAVRVVYFVATVIALAVGGLLWRNRDRKAAVPLCVGLLSTAGWAFGLLLSTAASPAVATAAIRLVYAFVGIAIAAAVVFALEYTGRERYLRRETYAILSIHPLAMLFVPTLNPNGVFFRSLEATSTVGVTQEWGPAFWAHFAYSYLAVTIYGLLLIAFLYRARHTLYRGQTAALVAGLLSPVPMNLLFTLGIIEIDTTPIGFIIGSTFYTVAIVRYEYINITPIAREKVMESVRDGILIVDTNDQIVDSNPAARELLGLSPSAVGDTVDSVFGLPNATQIYEELTETVEPTTRTVSYGGTSLLIEVTPVMDDRERHVGWLFLLADVTERIRRERDLERQIEKLDQFASLVSHDLRNPINVVSGYIEQTKATGDLSHLDKAEEATERMDTIIQDALTLAREGQDVTDPEEISLEAAAQEAWETVETEGATLVVERDARIIADPSRLQRLFENLFRNAVEHGADPDGDGPSSSDLVVTVCIEDETPAELTIAVCDNGTGIPDEDIDQVFEGGYTTNRGGTGLGLAIVEQIARAHDWTVQARRSRPEGDTGGGPAATGGARFEISGVTKPLSSAQTSDSASGLVDSPD